MHLNFDRFSEDLAEGLSSEGPAEAELSLLTEEVKIGCTLAMLQCLDRQHRLGYVLGESLEIAGPDAAEVLGISPELFRKRLQHARTAIMSFTRAHCGLASDTAACACNRRVSAAIRVGRVQPDALNFATDASSFAEARVLVGRVEEARRALEVHRTSSARVSMVDFARRLTGVLESQGD